MSTLTHIGTGITVVGTLRAGEDLTIAGRVRGRIEAEGAVIIEAGAIIEADVLARELIVRGVVIGDLTVVDTLEVTANGQVLGNVTSRRIHLRPGGRIQGDVSTGVEQQGFIYPDRVAANAPRRNVTGTGSRPGVTAPQARPTLETGFSGRGGLREGARSWLSDAGSSDGAAAEERRFTPHFDVSATEESKPEPTGEGF